MSDPELLVMINDCLIEDAQLRLEIIHAVGHIGKQTRLLKKIVINEGVGLFITDTEPQRKKLVNEVKALHRTVFRILECFETKPRK